MNPSTAERLHRLSLYCLYTFTIASVIYLIYYGFEYYTLPLHDRPRATLHDQLKPSGFIGHGLGIIGTALMILLLSYSARKRIRSMQRLGNIRWWLNYHIWMGVTGPILVIFHTAFKLGGIVSIAFWSMIAVALSGVAGRYIYIQIPRSLYGHELTVGELKAMVQSLRRQLSESYGVRPETLSKIVHFISSDHSGNSPAGLMNLLIGDVQLRINLRNTRKLLLKQPELSSIQVAGMMKLIKRAALLERRIALLAQAHKLLHHWHIFHRPFAAVMLVFMLVHVAVAFIFGYHWVL